MRLCLLPFVFLRGCGNLSPRIIIVPLITEGQAQRNEDHVQTEVLNVNISLSYSVPNRMNYNCTRSSHSVGGVSPRLGSMLYQVQFAHGVHCKAHRRISVIRLAELSDEIVMYLCSSPDNCWFIACLNPLAPIKENWATFVYIYIGTTLTTLFNISILALVLWYLHLCNNFSLLKYYAQVTRDKLGPGYRSVF